MLLDDRVVFGGLNTYQNFNDLNKITYIKWSYAQKYPWLPVLCFCLELLDGEAHGFKPFGA